MINNKYIVGLFTILFLLLSTSCERRSKQDVLMLYPNWAEGIAITHLAKVALEDKGYSVVLKRIEPGPIYAALSRGDADVYMDAWLPNTHQDYWERFGHRLDHIGTVFDDGITGLVVPSYIPINSIEELNEHKSKFDGKIYGIAAGAGIHTNTEKVIVEYNLDYNQLTSSETSMVTALRAAVAREEWIVITGWKPHFIWANYDLKPLADPKGVYLKDEIRIVSRKGFVEDNPEMGLFFKNFALEEELLNELITLVDGDRDPNVGAMKFYKKYKDLL